MESGLETVVEDEAEVLDTELGDEVVAPDDAPTCAKGSSKAKMGGRKRPIRRKKKKGALSEPRPDTLEEGEKSPSSEKSLTSFMMLAADFEAAIDDLSQV